MKVGIIGCGHWGPNVIRNFLKHGRATVAAICDQKEAALAPLKEIIPPQCRALSDPDQILADPQIDAAVIITPATTHYDLVKRALQAGKHVLCEKPLCLTARECEDLCLLAEKQGLKFMVSHTFLFNQ